MQNHLRTNVKKWYPRAVPRQLNPINFLLLLGLCSSLKAEPGDKVYQKGFLSPQDSLQSIEVPEGYKLELVLSDPIVEEPAMVAWDGNGVMYVVQMRTYMRDLDATGEKKPESRITRHVDTNGDGTYDRHSIYADNLVLPRFVLPLDDRVMVGITDTLDLWTYRDTTGDGIADERIKVHKGGRRGGNMEHQPSGLMWGLDNWLYLTYRSQRYRYTNDKIEVQKIPRGSGQWGLTQDDWGRLYFSSAGGEKPAIDYQQPISYGSLNLSGQQEKNFSTVYPIANIPDVQGGAKRINRNGGLNHFTGGGGQSIFRGDRLPKELYGDLILGEPVGRLIRRAKVKRKDAKSILSNAHPNSEFIRAKDANFRPIWTATTPRGQMMIVDMHHGIIQQANWTKKGSYLRGVIEKWGLQKNIGKGRIYRLVHKDFEAGPQPRMLEEATSELIVHLSHPNGWWRDTAQKLIILRDDRETVVPALESLVTQGSSEFGRLHALWALEGMGKINPRILTKALTDSSSMVRTSAIRVAEPYLASGDEMIVASLTKSFPKDPEMVVQMLNSLAASGASHPDLVALAETLTKQYNKLDAVKAGVEARKTLIEDRERAVALKQQGEQFAAAMLHGKEIYQQLCFSCHGEKGEGTPMGGAQGQRLAPPFGGSKRITGSGESAIRIVLHGLVGPIDNKTYPGLMAPMADNDDPWIADIITYVRNSFGNEAPFIRPETVTAIRKQHEGRTQPWTLEELAKFEPTEIPYQKDWKLTASHNAKALAMAFDRDLNTRYSTERRMTNNMWIQIEFPEETALSAVVLDTGKSKTDSPNEYIVQSSLDGKNWSNPLAQGEGQPYLDISLPPTKAKYLRIIQNGRKRYFWSIAEMKILGLRPE